MEERDRSAELEELEGDAPDDVREKLKEDVYLDSTEATLNAIPVAEGNMLMTLTDSGMQHLLAGIRASAGMVSGRYMYEVKIVEALSPPTGKAKSTYDKGDPCQLVRVGVSTRGSSVILADGQDNVCFDSEGHFIHGRARVKVSQKFARGEIVALLVNLDDKSPNANTVSLFRDGVRVSNPQPLPDCLRGKTLFPTLTYRNVTLQVNFGPTHFTRLPFVCRLLQDIALDDVRLAPPPARTVRCAVVVPVGLPDTGVFDWADDFLEKNPTYVELSDRKILQWASKSGLRRDGGYEWADSLDQPGMGFGVPCLDDRHVCQSVLAVASTLTRNFLVLQIRSNLVEEERSKLLQRFSADDFTRIAMVMLGEPTEAYKRKVQELVLADKSTAAREYPPIDFAVASTAKAAQTIDASCDPEMAGGELPVACAEASGGGPAAEAVELTEDEKKLWHRRRATPDITKAEFLPALSNFSLPTEAEGFDSVDYPWQPADRCADLLKEYVLDKKLTERIDSLRPGEWFRQEWKRWTKLLQEWRALHTQWRNPTKRKALLEKRNAVAKGDEGEAGEKVREVFVEDEDVHAVADVKDLGNGEPLFSKFEFEDWSLLSLRFELHLLLHSFRRDAGNLERTSFIESHLLFYYNRYFTKNLMLHNFAVDCTSKLFEFFEDALALDETGQSYKVPRALLPEDTAFDKFMKFAEEQRRDRQRRVDAGDETACLKFPRPNPPVAKPNSSRPAPCPQMPCEAASRDGPGTVRVREPQSAGPARTTRTAPPGRQGAPAALPLRSGYHDRPLLAYASGTQAQKRPYPPGPAPPCVAPAKQARSYGYSVPASGPASVPAHHSANPGSRYGVDPYGSSSYGSSPYRGAPPAGGYGR